MRLQYRNMKEIKGKFIVINAFIVEEEKNKLTRYAFDSKS